MRLPAERTKGLLLLAVSALLSVLEKNTSLIDQILAAATLNAWMASKPQLTNATQFFWDYASGHGSVTGDITPLDPTTNVIYRTRPPVAAFLGATGLKAGLVPPALVREIAVKDLAWGFSTRSFSLRCPPLPASEFAAAQGAPGAVQKQHICGF